MNLAAIVLAAGSATRFGSDKLSAQFMGRPLVQHAIQAARAAPVGRVIVIATPTLDIGAWDTPLPLDIIRIRSSALSDSLKAGIAAARDAEGAFIFLGDMPLIPHEVAGRLAAVLKHHFAAIPRHAGRPGHPVLLSRCAFGQIARLEGDQGAGKLLRQRSDVAFEECSDPGVLLDVDRVEDIRRLQDEGKKRE